MSITQKRSQRAVNKRYMWIDKEHVNQIVDDLGDSDVIDAEHIGVVLYIGKVR